MLTVYPWNTTKYKYSTQLELLGWFRFCMTFLKCYTKSKPRLSNWKDTSFVFLTEKPRTVFLYWFTITNKIYESKNSYSLGDITMNTSYLLRICPIYNKTHSFLWRIFLEKIWKYSYLHYIFLICKNVVKLTSYSKH